MVLSFDENGSASGRFTREDCEEPSLENECAQNTVQRGERIPAGRYRLASEFRTQLRGRIHGRL